MKITLSTEQAVNMILANKYKRWSYNGALALVRHLEQLEWEQGEDMEFDVDAICCDYREYKNLVKAAKALGWKPEENDEHSEGKALEFLKDHTDVIEFDGGVVISYI